MVRGSIQTKNALISDGGGIRIVCFGFAGRGKSGGARIVYLFSGADVPVFLLAVFAKNEKANISAAERNALAALVTDMITACRKRGRR